MKSILLSLLILALPAASRCQEIINYVMVGDKGITQDAREAKFVILIKRFGDSSFQRLEYRFTGPLVRIVTYSDANMQVREGIYREFDAKGLLTGEGQYKSGKKDGDWYQLDDSLHPLSQNRYHLDTLLFSWNADSIRIHDEQEKAAYTKAHAEDSVKGRETEASFRGGDQGWAKYVGEKLKDNYPDRARSIGAAGSVWVQFIVDTHGKITNAEIIRSVELSLDETTLKVLYQSPPWTPAFQRDHLVKAFRRQKITFSLPD